MTDFDGFTGREKRLQAIIRYNMERRTPMFYRTNDFLHSQRVHLIVQDVLPVISRVCDDTFNPDKALTLALVHDDAELITGDVQVYHKDRMTPVELEKLDQDEAAAIEELAKQWPQNVNGFDYKELLYHALYKDCPEAQLVSWADKMDAFCESLHEMHAGNQRFVGCTLAYITKLHTLPEKLAYLQRVIGLHPFLQKPKAIDAEDIINTGRYHSQESVMKQTGILHYDRWKQLTIEHLGIESLIEVKEGPGK